MKILLPLITSLLFACNIAQSEVAGFDPYYLRTFTNGGDTVTFSDTIITHNSTRMQVTAIGMQFSDDYDINSAHYFHATGKLPDTQKWVEFEATKRRRGIQLTIDTVGVESEGITKIYYPIN